MKLENPIIAPEKIRDYLLKPLLKNDKSKFLAAAGYTLTNWQEFDADLKEFAVEHEAVFIETTQYGNKFEIIGVLKGRNGCDVRIKTGWLLKNNEARFVTLFPDKR